MRTRSRQGLFIIIAFLFGVAFLLLMTFGHSIISTSQELAGDYNPAPVASQTSDDSAITLGVSGVSGPQEYNDSPSLGDPLGDVVLSLFGDFECPACATMQQTVSDVLADYPTGVRLVWKDFPLSYHLSARYAANAARCAQEQGKFWEIHDTLYAHQDELTESGIRELAQSVGVSTAAFDACLSSQRYDSRVARDMAEAVDLQVTGVPTLYIGDVPHSGVYTPDELRDVIDAALAASTE